MSQTLDGNVASGLAMFVNGSVQQMIDTDANGYMSIGTPGGGGTAYLTLARPATATPAGTKNLRVLDAADTARTASTEFHNVHFNANLIRTWATGALALQRDHRFSGGAIAFVGGSTCTQAATVGIDSAPSAGTNCTLTDAYGLLVAASVRAGFGGQLVGNLKALPLGYLAFDWTATGDANATLTASQQANPLIVCTGATLGATRNLIMASNPIAGGIYWVKNSTGGAQSIQVIGTSGTGVTIATGKAAWVMFDGTNFVRMTADV
jgi:hypothetical protein